MDDSINKKIFSHSATPTTNQVWKKESEENRIKLVLKELKKNILYRKILIFYPKNYQKVSFLKQ